MRLTPFTSVFKCSTRVVTGVKRKPFLTRGEKGKILVDAQAISLLERAVVLKDRGVPYDRLSESIEAEMAESPSEPVHTEGGKVRESAENRRESAENQPAECLICRERAARIELLEERIAELKEERDLYRQIALPNPKGKRWWQFWR